ncbi:MAG: apolipoprotein N-acyltransferase [Acidobacteria bacterium]|nr:apolipoprotein N-acyltransferase [Acidobacteriota bacterium]
MALDFVKRILPSWKNAALALLAAGLLILAFPDFEYWFLAWFALVPLMWAVEREASIRRSFVLGWLFGTAFFFGTCWWLTYAPIHYAAFPWPLAYFLILIVCIGAGIFPAIFAAVLSALLKRFGSWAVLAAPFIWVFSEFMRYWLTGNNWNAIGYSQAFTTDLISIAATGGVYLVSFAILELSGFATLLLSKKTKRQVLAHLSIIVGLLCVYIGHELLNLAMISYGNPGIATIIALQPNVPMSGVDYQRLGDLRTRQFALSEREVTKLDVKRINSDRTVIERKTPAIVILPESPMNFMYNDDREFQQFVREFTTRNNVSLIFNSAEPDATNGKYFNSAMMIGADGKVVAQYDKIYLLPFGEAVPVPLDAIVPGFVGNFSYGREYDLLPIGDAKAGVMICFESHFGQLSRRFVADGADVIIEMTNDGYLGPTPVLRQHLANAVFRAVETNRPILRVTNVGITAYITEKGAVLDPTAAYQEDTRVWTVSKSDGSQTFYVKYGDWFAWLCSMVTIVLLLLSFKRRDPAISN